MSNVRSIFLILLILLGLKAISQTEIAYYPFDNNVADFSGNHNDGQMRGGVKATADRFGNPCAAVQFNGKDAFIEVPNSPSLASPLKSFSVTCWFKMDSTYFTKNYRWLTIICKGNTFEEYYNNPQYRVQMFQSPIQSTISINTDFTEYDTNFVAHKFTFGQWYFYALTYDGSFVRAYVDNIKIWEFKYSKTLNVNVDPLNIGKDVPGDLEFFYGALDELHIFNGAITETEITDLYKRTPAVASSETIDMKCPENMEVSNDPGQCYARVNFNKASIDAHCGSGRLRQVGGLRTGDKFPIGASTITYELTTSSGAVKTCQSIITVLDKEAPQFICPRDTVIMLSDINAAGMIFQYTMPKATDNCSHASVKLASGLPSGAMFPRGKTVLHFQATDDANNISDCSFAVYLTSDSNTVVVDAAQCIGDITKESDYGLCGATVRYSFPEGMDIRKYRQLEGLSSGRLFPCGTTINRFQRERSNKIIEECAFKVTVLEHEAPIIQCPSDTIIYSSANATSMIYNYEAPNATDNCAIDSLVQVQGPASGTPFMIGNNSVTFKATDASGNSTQCTFQVMVLDTHVNRKDSREKTVTKSYLPDKVSYTPDLKFNKCQLTLVLYDDGQEDNDTVSVYFNGVEIVQREMIKLKQHRIIVRTVMLEPGQKNDFIVKAWNNGSISPNTIKIEFYEGVYHENGLSFKKQTPKKVRVLHSKPGVAGAISISCSK